MDAESLRDQDIESFLFYYVSKVLRGFAENKNKKVLYALGKYFEEKITNQLDSVKEFNLDIFKLLKLAVTLLSTVF